MHPNYDHSLWCRIDRYTGGDVADDLEMREVDGKVTLTFTVGPRARALDDEFTYWRRVIATLQRGEPVDGAEVRARWKALFDHYNEVVRADISCMFTFSRVRPQLRAILDSKC